MSQEKVDRYKQEKLHRKEIMRKEKIRHIFRRCVVTVAALALLGWLSYSAYGVYKTNQPRPTAEVDYTEFNNYLQTLSE